ncbi:MAG: amidohydrolase [Armatimonadetes bacterium]|nr:amidohydrolase [Armatimonadota bacterium]
MTNPHTLFLNGDITTLDDAVPHATALVVRDGRIVFVGDDEDAEAFAGAGAARTDLSGRCVVPGFCDAHLHVFWWGLLLTRQADLTGADSIDEVLVWLSDTARMSDKSGTGDGWILGRGFDQDKLRENRFPTRTDLDRVSTTRPVLITRVCGHAAVANSAALALLTDDERALGEPESGLYTETAIAAIRRYVPPMTNAESDDAVSQALTLALSRGFTAVGTLLDTPEQMGAYLRLKRAGKLPPVRVSAHPPHKAAVGSLAENGIATGFGDEFLRYGGAKLFTDGSLGARTAYLAAPYSDDPAHPDNRGIRIYDPEALKGMALDAQNKGWQLVIHAIGDQAVRETLDAIEYALDRSDRDNTYHRHRVEHASILPPDLLERMARRKILGVLQPQFVTSDTWSGERVGAERAANTYPFRRMLDAGIPLALSSDCPVEIADPFLCLAAAVFRHPWSPDECLTMREALRLYCVGGAYAAFAETERGSLSVGKFADFVTISGDLFACETREAVTALSVETVFVGGRQVWAS